MLERKTHEIDFLRKPDPAPSVEVDVDSLEAAGLDIDDVIRPALRRFAEKHPQLRATIYLYTSPSVNFGDDTWSAFLGVSGDEKVLHAVRDAFSACSGVRSRFSDYIPLRSAYARFHIENGGLWQMIDDANWGLVTDKAHRYSGTLEQDDSEALLEEEELLDEDCDSEVSESSGDTALPRRGRLRAARSDASVGTIRETIEQIFGLPPGSVALCGPDKRPLRADATIATLRRRWE